MKNQNKESDISVVLRAIKSEGHFTTTQILTVLFYFRVVLALIFGLLFGIFGIKGMVGFFTYLGVVIAGSYQYIMTTLKYDQFSETQNPFLASLWPSVCVFIVSWSLIYTIKTT